MLVRCRLTVLSVMNSRAAICALLSAWASSRSTSISRADSGPLSGRCLSRPSIVSLDTDSSTLLWPRLTERTAAISSSRTIVLTRYAEAPASSSWCTKAESSCMVSTTMRVYGAARRSCLIVVVAGAPGISTSSRMTSGRCSPASATASGPLAPSATTVNRGSVHSSSRRPWRKSVWSSTTTTRTTPSSVNEPPGQRQPCLDRGPAAERAGDRQGPAEQLHPLSHRGHPDAGRGRRSTVVQQLQDVSHVEAPAVVRHRGPQLAVGQLQVDTHRGGLAVHQGVAHRLAQHQIHLFAHLPSERRGVADHREVHLDFARHVGPQVAQQRLLRPCEPT